ncbi:LysR family transcriptional regulator [Ancylobacter sp. Lp-2]|uniref:LysR family transcriptional regulator n=1 Tax=Ancylobacter sp. Lp-2 TaxID=2881339 RepID=UPI001E291475|nr:LysR family transcriptional regulator [Ancylobacter sp. Lp-2]MCB4771916.1 LysR family transcriptional regulator [Ancylobacter sp. Lp-2]
MDLDELAIFVAVVRAGGFRDAARAGNASASSLSDAVRRLEARLGVRLLHRTTRSITPTEAGRRLFERLTPALAEIGASLDEVNAFRDRPSGTLKLNVPANVARTVLPAVIVPFLKAYPDIKLEVTVEDGFIDIVAGGFDAGIRYDERLAQDMIALPIGPRMQRFATAAAPAYLDAHGRPAHPRDLLAHACLRGRFAGGTVPTWEFERDGEIVRLDPTGPLLTRPSLTADLMIDAACGGLGVVSLFEDWLAPHLASGALEPILQEWWPSFPGPFLYYPGRRYLPGPLRAFVDFVRKAGMVGVT